MQSLRHYLQEKIMDNLPWKSVVHLFAWATLGITSFYIGRFVLRIVFKLLGFAFS